MESLSLQGREDVNRFDILSNYGNIWTALAEVRFNIRCIEGASIPESETDPALLNDKVTVYPVPVTDRLNIGLKGFRGSTALTIQGLDGRGIFTSEGNIKGR